MASNQPTNPTPAPETVTLDPFEQANATAHAQYEQNQALLAQLQQLVSGLPALITQQVQTALRQSGVNPPPTAEPGVWRAIKGDRANVCPRCRTHQTSWHMFNANGPGLTRTSCTNPGCKLAAFPPPPYYDEDGIYNAVVDDVSDVPEGTPVDPARMPATVA